MNRSQRCVVIGVTVAIFVALLFPPLHFISGSGAVRNEGYGFLFAPPSLATINVPVLLVEWLAATLVGALLWFVARNGAQKRGTGAEADKGGVPPG